MCFDFSYESFTLRELRSYMPPVICQWKEYEKDCITKGHKTDFWEPAIIYLHIRATLVVFQYWIRHRVKSIVELHFEYSEEEFTSILSYFY